ncbi:hypothetical protein TREMEDRAFT_65782 [Tremella mesenterica DSM 1558]|uniref:uncharacterized protein n=1 Tax=Tremella mesenterica (strain ATCC 24925 / CBS 8224 / DSM 1558 / NBRC 9311 / NRRL Y-6157 / RJB 2259-6 / UBC 559-6) TaxID=578456 RepID=UPI00032CB730|nr:uncharacterized protein TREMEDRAFT_65782 [Tremella mesenterica DSM 1558]EIW66179.1 hypothetical protein TREMEDRAFT_65782 [Tremella mesenterica DSM 1558]
MPKKHPTSRRKPVPSLEELSPSYPLRNRTKTLAASISAPILTTPVSGGRDEKIQTPGTGETEGSRWRGSLEDVVMRRMRGMGKRIQRIQGYANQNPTLLNADQRKAVGTLPVLQGIYKELSELARHSSQDPNGSSKKRQKEAEKEAKEEGERLAFEQMEQYQDCERLVPRPPSRNESGSGMIDADLELVDQFLGMQEQEENEDSPIQFLQTDELKYPLPTIHVEQDQPTTDDLPQLATRHSLPIVNRPMPSPTASLKHLNPPGQVPHPSPLTMETLDRSAHSARTARAGRFSFNSQSQRTFDWTENMAGSVLTRHLSAEAVIPYQILDRASQSHISTHDGQTLRSVPPSFQYEASQTSKNVQLTPSQHSPNTPTEVSSAPPARKFTKTERDDKSDKGNVDGVQGASRAPALKTPPDAILQRLGSPFQLAQAEQRGRERHTRPVVDEDGFEKVGKRYVTTPRKSRWTGGPLRPQGKEKSGGMDVEGSTSGLAGHAAGSNEGEVKEWRRRKSPSRRRSTGKRGEVGKHEMDETVPPVPALPEERRWGLQTGTDGGFVGMAQRLDLTKRDKAEMVRAGRGRGTPRGQAV